MPDFTTLPVWTKSHNLALKFYKTTAAFPTQEQNGLVSQIRHASADIPANIAAACGRTSPQEASRLFGMAMDSSGQLDYFLLLSRDLNMVGGFDYDLLHNELLQIKRLLAEVIVQLDAARRALPAA